MKTPTPKNLREHISEILISWGMPTRQTAINELEALITKREYEALEKYVVNLVGKRCKDFNNSCTVCAASRPISSCPVASAECSPRSSSAS